MLSSLERDIVVGAFVVQTSGATRAFHKRSGTHRPAGVGDHVQTGIGVPQGLGRSCRFHGRILGWGYRVNNPRPGVVCTQRRRERNMRAPVVPPSEGNEVRREERQEVAVP